MKQWSDKAEGDKWYKWFICNRSAETTMTLWPKRISVRSLQHRKNSVWLSRLEETPLFCQEFPLGCCFLHTSGSPNLPLACHCSRIISIHLQYSFCKFRFTTQDSAACPCNDLVSAHCACDREPSLFELQMFLPLCMKEQVAAGQQVDRFPKRSLGKSHRLSGREKILQTAHLRTQKEFRSGFPLSFTFFSLGILYI